MKLRKCHEESYLASEIVSDQFWNYIKNKIFEYGSENIYYSDETRIFLKFIPCKTVCKNVRNGYKLLKNIISLLLCTNINKALQKRIDKFNFDIWIVKQGENVIKN